jgi:NAD+ kinase
MINTPPKVIGVIAHAGKEGAAPVVRAVVSELRRRNAPFFLEKMTASLIGELSSHDESYLAEHTDLLLVLGGDGSILRALHRSGGHIRPIFGINIGSLGFLTCLGSDEYLRAVESVVTGNYLLSSSQPAGSGNFRL